MTEPTTLEEAMVWLEAKLEGGLCADFGRMAEKDATFHLSGCAVRNALRLWHTDYRPPIWRFFKDTYNIDHPDDISSIIIVSLHRKLNDRPLDVKAQVCRCHQHWATDT